MTFTPEELLAMYNSSKEELIQLISKLAGERNMLANNLQQAKDKNHRLKNYLNGVEEEEAMQKFQAFEQPPKNGRFFMLYVEGMQTPAVKHTKKRKAVKIAVAESERLGRKVYLLSAKGFIAAPKKEAVPCSDA